MGIFGITCLLVLANYVLGKPVNHLLKNIGNVNWKEKTSELWEKLRPYAKKAGRTATKPVLTLYYVLKDGDLSTSEKVMVYAAMIYVLSPWDLLPASVYSVLGVLDDGVAVSFVYKKISEKVTDEIRTKVDDTLNEWFSDGTFAEVVE
ncbi:MAG: DUF1232 domain-containing protein [Paludibacteraceae bacterium]|nr:DUF1232 domain-containing protein [Paludibacteraceae bacterium]